MLRELLAPLVTALYDVPPPVLLACAIIATLGVVWAVQCAIPDPLRARIWEPHNEFSGHISGFAGVAYAVLLGFLTVLFGSNITMHKSE